jgi:hypothetical protein
MREIKIMGFEDKVQDLVQAERIRETKEMERFTWVMVWVNVVGMYQFTPLYGHTQSSNDLSQ